MPPLRILVVAEEAAGAQVLKRIERTPHEVVAVMTGARRGGGLSAVSTVAGELGYATWPSSWVKRPDLADRIREERIDILLNVHSLYVIHREVVAAPRIGSFNLHPGPLPRYAGLNTVSWAILRGEREYGVTVHWMVADIDRGAIAYLEPLGVADDETALSLSARCAKAGIPLLLRVLEVAADDPRDIPAEPQDPSGWQYFDRSVPGDGWIDWTRPAREIERFVRACDYGPFRSPWGHPRTDAEGVEVAILKARLTGQPAGEPAGTVSAGTDAGVLVAAGDEWLAVRKVESGGKPVDAARVLQVGRQVAGPG